ncbi:hypothetical protein [Neobacillus drentensis]|uniref:hypothetical protein n=1 Tax=Neobacillus drentensis TaxID=220684 RepID=UPI002FFD5A5C
MPKVFWYYTLIIIGATLLIFTGIKKKKNIPEMFSFFVFVTGLSWGLELIIMLILDAYEYKPGLFNNRVAENIVGHLIANTALWSSTAILIMYFQLSTPWLCLLSVSFMLIEELFIKVDAYDHNWWKTYMTGIGVFLFMWAMKKWYSKFYGNGYKWMRLIMCWVIAWVLITTVTSTLILLGKLFFYVDWSENIYRTSIEFSGFLYNVLMASVATFFVSFLKKTYWCVVPFVLFLSGDILLHSLHILRLYDGWNVINLAILRALSIGMFIICEKYTLKQSVF